jgi:hypothetical protein
LAETLLRTICGISRNNLETDAVSVQVLAHYIATQEADNEPPILVEELQARKLDGEIVVNIATKDENISAGKDICHLRLLLKKFFIL